jgi:hypothetical protein
MSDLVFVPSLLKPTFERDSVETVGDLLALNIENLRARTGWGDRKVRLFSTLQKLYGDCANRGAFIDGDSDVSSVIASELLPDVRCGEMTVSDFVKSSADTLKLKGRKKADFDGLKRFFHAYAGYTASVEGTWHFSFLDGFEHVEMDWRDVPMNVSKRVADFLDRFQVVTLHQLDRLAVTAHFTCPNTGELLPALKQENFGKTSLASLQNEIEKLGRLGLDGYRHGVICSLEHLPDPNMEWREIPLKLPKRVVGFLDAFEVRTLRQVYKLAVRARVLCPESGELLPALDQKEFSEKLLDDSPFGQIWRQIPDCVKLWGCMRNR